MSLINDDCWFEYQDPLRTPKPLPDLATALAELKAGNPILVRLSVPPLFSGGPRRSGVVYIGDDGDGSEHEERIFVWDEARGALDWFGPWQLLSDLLPAK